jgi:hypothetical protein
MVGALRFTAAHASDGSIVESQAHCEDPLWLYFFESTDVSIRLRAMDPALVCWRCQRVVGSIDGGAAC